MAEHTDETIEIDGRAVRLPLEIAAARFGVGVFAADAEAVAAALPDGLAPICRPGGRAIVTVMLVDYRQNPLGDYDEAAVGFAARPVDAGLVSGAGLWIEHMPVSQPFTRAAGETIWGYPKTLDPLRIDDTDREAAIEWRRDGAPILTLRIATRGWLPLPTFRSKTYTLKDGRLFCTPLAVWGSRARVSPGRARVELGDHPVGQRLAALGIAPRAFSSVWVERAAMRFDRGAPLGG